jgi:predicted alpha-1,2-mannosidase
MGALRKDHSGNSPYEQPDRTNRLWKNAANSCFRLPTQLASRAGRPRFRMVTIPLLLLIGFVSATGGTPPGQAEQSGGPASSVDPFIGTGKGPGGGQNLFPGAVTPFGMVQLSPDTESRGYGYHYFQPDIQGFSMTHMSGPGCPNEGDVFFTATTGPVLTKVSDFESPYSHAQESASPGYYQVLLARWGIHAELTATNRTGMARFTFPAGKAANILVPISHTLNHTVAAEVGVTSDNQITGYVTDQAFCGNQQIYKVYFVMTFSRPFESFGTWQGTPMTPALPYVVPNRGLATQTKHDQRIGAYASWPAANQSQTITIRIGISYVDLAGAENNLKAEAAGKDFEQVRAAARAAWNKALGVIQVSGGSEAEQKIFYTALYHSLLMPSIFNDADGRYLGFDGEIHQVAASHLIYCNFSGWDIYRSEIPLLALIAPRRMEDMAESIVLMYQQGGWIGRWPQINLYTNVMAGSPLTVALCNAWLDGLHGFNMKTAWEGMFRDATEAPPPGRPYIGQEGIKWINKLHYVPNDKVKYGSVSQIQEDCIAYASLYRLAVALGKTEEAKELYQRALYYRNVFDREDSFFRPKNADGQRTPNFDPAREDEKPGSTPTGFIEGPGWHYQWLAPSDMAWLIEAMGRDRFNQRLLNFFNYKKPGWYGQYYNPYNETDLEAPFEFNFSREPWQAQRAVRRILKENYTASYDGIPGNDDCGEMSSWAVLTMMGIYTVDPASLAYELVSPMFNKVVVRLHEPYQGKAFTVETSANPETTPYIKSVKLNGRKHRKNWISFKDISAGGTIQFALKAEPNKKWGSGKKDVPPSLSEQRP